MIWNFFKRFHPKDEHKKQIRNFIKGLSTFLIKLLLDLYYFSVQFMSGFKIFFLSHLYFFKNRIEKTFRKLSMPGVRACFTLHHGWLFSKFNYLFFSKAITPTWPPSLQPQTWTAWTWRNIRCGSACREDGRTGGNGLMESTIMSQTGRRMSQTMDSVPPSISVTKGNETHFKEIMRST